MAHYGRIYPNSQNLDLGVLFAQGWTAPRKWWIETSATSVGTLTVPWRSLRILSSERIYTEGTGIIEWDFLCPTDSTNVIRMKWQFADFYDPPSITQHWLVKVTAHFRKDGTEIAYLDSFQATGEQFFGSNMLWHSFNTWPHSTNRGQVDSQNNCRFGAAIWADDPAFHPYRH